MGSVCGTLNVRESAIIETWTDRQIRHGPASCFCYVPCVNSVKKIQHVELKLHEFALLQDTRDPSATKYVYGPLLFKYENPYQQLGYPTKMPILDQNDFLIVTDASGSKRTVVGPTVFRPIFGEEWGQVREAINVEVNHYVVILDRSSPNDPVRHVRGPVKIYLGPYDEVLAAPDNRLVRPCIRIDETNAIWLKKADGQTLLVDEPQFFMPSVGEVVERTITKTILKESEFCIIIAPNGENLLYMGNNPQQRSFFLPPFHRFHLFQMGSVAETVDKWDTLPRYIPNKFIIRTADSVQVVLDCRISFSIFEPALYVKKPIDFWQQISYWVQNEMLDVYAKQNFREFLKTYADDAKSACERAYDFFHPFGLKLLDVQVINYACHDVATQKILDQDIITRVTKQNELYAKEADVNIMEREKAVQLQQMAIEFQRKEKENETLLKRKELEIAVRMKEVDLQIEEEKKRTSLMNVKRENALKEGEFEGAAQGASVAAFISHLPDTLSIQEKVHLWSQLRDLEKSTMLYNKVDKISMYPPGADIKQLQITLDPTLKNKHNGDHHNGNDGSSSSRSNDDADSRLMEHALVPAILGYNADSNRNKSSSNGMFSNLMSSNQSNALDALSNNSNNDANNSSSSSSSSNQSGSRKKK